MLPSVRTITIENIILSPEFTNCVRLARGLKRTVILTSRVDQSNLINKGNDNVLAIILFFNSLFSYTIKV